MLLHFPHLHPECVPGGPLPGVLFLDPGLSEGADKELYQPNGLPLDAVNARHLLDDCVHFGEQFSNPKEMAYFGVQERRGGRGESTSALEAELGRRLGGDKSKEEADPQVARSQFLLLLAWALEERIIELRKLSRGMEEAWNRFGSTLGVDEEDSLDGAELQLDNLVSNMHAPDSGTPALPWVLLLEAVCAFLPEDATLVVRDPDVIAAFDDTGIEFGLCSAETGLPEGALCTQVPAWRLAGLTKEPAKRPLLARFVRVAVVPM